MVTKKEVIKNNPYLPELKKILSYKRETPDSFTIRLDWQLDHKPGQFIFCSLPGIGEAPISICSSSKDFVELNIREVGNLTNSLAKLKEGDYLFVRGPYGTSYPMDTLKNNDIIIVGGGCGVAPLKGVIEFISKNRSYYKDISLFFGFRSPSDALFSDRHIDWEKDFNLHLAFDKLDQVGETCMSGTQGFVTQLIEDNIKDNLNKVAFLCGPPIMIEKVIEILKAKGFHNDQIFLSAERLMFCGMGKCGRCMIHGKYTCLDGSVFRYDMLDGASHD